MSQAKLAFVGAKKGELTIMLSPIEITIGVELAMPGQAPFMIKSPLKDHGAESMEILFEDMVKALVCLIQTYFEAQGVAAPVVEALAKAIMDAVKTLDSEYTSTRYSPTGSGVLDDVRDIEVETMFEAEFDVPEGFLEEAHHKVVLANSPLIRRTPLFQPKQVKTKPQTKIVERPAPSLKNIVQKFKTQQNKPVTGPMYVLVYDASGRPVGVRSIKGPGWKGIGGGGKVASEQVVELQGHREPIQATVYTDPNPTELAAAMGDDGEARALVFPDADTLLVWNAFEASHADIAKDLLPSLGLSFTDAIPVNLWPGGYLEVVEDARRTRWYHEPGTRQALQGCGALTGATGPIKEVFYFDEAEVGNWAELQEGVVASVHPLPHNASLLQSLRRTATARDAGAIVGVMVFADYPQEHRILALQVTEPGLGIAARLMACLGGTKSIAVSPAVTEGLLSPGR